MCSRCYAHSLEFTDCLLIETLRADKPLSFGVCAWDFKNPNSHAEPMQSPETARLADGHMLLPGEDDMSHGWYQSFSHECPTKSQRG